MITSQPSGLSALSTARLNSAQPSELQDPQQLLAQTAQKHIEGKALRAFQPLSAEQAASNILGFIERQLQRDIADGATNEELESRLQAGLEGFKKGFNEAKEKLEALNMLTDEVAADIGKTYQLVTRGIDDFYEQYGLTQAEPQLSDESVALQGVLRADYEYASAQSFSFTLKTQEGDRVTIQASASRGESAGFVQGDSEGGFSYASVSSSRYQLTVQGDLNDDELVAIGQLLEQVNQLADEFFTGDLPTAFEYASSLGYDAEQISGFALNLTRVEIQKASVAYQPTPGTQDLTSRLKPVGEFIQQLSHTLEVADRFADPEGLLQQIIDAMFADRSAPGNRDGDKFVSFTGQLLTFTDKLLSDFSDESPM